MARKFATASWVLDGRGEAGDETGGGWGGRFYFFPANCTVILS
jgi:hypothetical protein